ncbi:MAG TPA: GNAT family N-acetyltransferase [Candidatus Dormibacteraeota bacterium]|nr:GNAT family N-acetyltransferase [Candidatus Dormibacteraeota bacterium]
MAVSLREPDAADYETYAERRTAQYIEQIIAAGHLSVDAAREKALRDTAELLPDGMRTRGHVIRRVFADERAVGWLWFAEQSRSESAGVGHVYDLQIDEPYRRRGYAREAMLLAEEEAQTRGLHALTLNVFGHNAGARALYAELGYGETAVQMKKSLGRE